MSDQHSTVEYREVQDFPGYRVGSDGSVWTRLVRKGKGWRYGFPIEMGAWRPLKLRTNPNGRAIVCLAGGHWRQVHRIVLETFVGPCPEGMESCHNDGNPLNNHVSNLRWDTHKNNMADRSKHGRTPHGENHHDATLTEKQVLFIRRAHTPKKKSGKGTAKFLSEKFQVSREVIHRIISRKTWKHI